MRRMFVRALRDIEQGEELTVGYGKDYSDDQGLKMKCYCGEEKCSGWIGIQKHRVLKMIQNHSELFPNHAMDEIETLADDDDCYGGEDDEDEQNDEMMDLVDQFEKGREIEDEDSDATMEADPAEGNDDQDGGNVLQEDEEEEDTNDTGIGFVNQFVEKLKTFAEEKLKRNSNPKLKGGNQRGNSKPEIQCPACSGQAFSTKQNALKHLIRFHTEEAAAVFEAAMESYSSKVYVLEFGKCGWKTVDGKMKKSV